MLRSDQIQNIYRLSPMQEGIYFQSLLDERSQAYFSQVTYRYLGDLSLPNLAESLHQLMRRHDILRTVFNHKKADVVLQVVMRDRKPDLHSENLCDMDANAREQYLEGYRRRDRQRGFNLNQDVLMRLAIFQTGEQAYEFVWSHHHILMDGWCMGVLIQEFNEIYASLLARRSASLAPAVPYRAFIEWLEQRPAEEALLFWKQYLAGVEVATGIPRKQSKTPHAAYQNRELAYAFPLGLTERLQRVCHDSKVTLSTLMQTAWGILLGKYNYTNDAVFGLVVTVRPAAIQGIERMIGLFINTVPTRVQYQPSQSFQALVQKIQDANLEKEHHQYLSLAEIQAQSIPKQQLLDHSFIFENFPLAEQIAGTGILDEGLSTAQVTVQDTFAQTNYDFNLIVVPERQSYRIQLNYNAAVYGETFVRDVADHYVHLLEQIAENPAVRIGQLALLRPPAVEALLDWQSNPFPYLAPDTVSQFLENAATAHPDRVALIDGPTRLSYHALQVGAETVAAHIREHLSPVGPFSIGVRLERSAALAIAMLGVWKAGGTYVPIDPAAPILRARMVFEDAGVAGILSTGEWLKGFEPSDAPQWDVLNLPKNTAPFQPKSFPSPAPDALAYIIYTSGTSGQPKGVPIRHESIVNQALYHNRYLNLHPADAILWSASPGFDASIIEALMALGSGAKLVCASAAHKENPARLVEWMSQENVTLAILPPAYLRLLNDLPMPSLKRIISTGEAIHRQEALLHAAKRDVFNGYGPTEACIGATFHQIDPMRREEYDDLGSVLIGRPFDNMAVYVLDADGQILPPGIVGEIAVAGIGVATGYLHAAADSHSKFLPNPYARRDFERRLYLTGDLGRWTQSGELAYLGRKDDQLQLNGIRVEPAEIATQLRLLEGVKDALVILQEGVLEGYVLAETGFDTRLALEQLRERLPVYMRPAHLSVLDAFPVTASGKIDRAKLPARAVPTHHTAADPLPEDPVLSLLLTQVQAVLGRPDARPSDDFLALGGDSIKAIQLVSRLYRNGYQLSIRDVFQSPVLAQLLEKIIPLQNQAEQGMVEGSFPIPPIWHAFFQRALAKPHHYNQAVLFFSSTPMEPLQVQQLFEALIRHHDVLRLSVSFDETGMPQPHIHGAAIRPNCLYFDLRGQPDASTQRLAICQATHQSLQLDTAPLWAVVHFCEEDGDRLLLTVHHLLVDGISWRILLEDLETLFDQLKTQKPLVLPPKTDSYQRWATELHNFAHSDVFSPEIQFWSAYTRQPAGQLPLAQTADTGIQIRHIRFGADSTQSLLDRVQSIYGNDMTAVLLGAFGLALHHSFGNQPFWIMLEGHGREELPVVLNTARTVGWFTSLYPFLLPAETNAADGHAWTETVKGQLAAIPRKGMGHGIFQWLYSGEEDKVLPQMDLLFNYLGTFNETVEGRHLMISDEPLGQTEAPQTDLPFALAFSGLIAEKALQLRLRYDASRIAPTTIEQLAIHLETALYQLIQTAPSQLLPSLDALTGRQHLTQVELQAIAHFHAARGNPIQDIYPLSPLQEGMYFQTAIAQDTLAYFYQVVYTVKGGVDPAIVRDSLGQLVRRHDILRTAFHHTFTDKILQVVLREPQPEFYFEDLRQQHPSARMARVAQFVRQDQEKPFDLASGTLIRLSLLQTADQGFTFIWSTHHILMDGWCMGILLEEFLRIYQGNLSSHAVRLPLPSPYSQYISWLEQQNKAAAMAHWSRYLAGYPQAVGLPYSKTNSSAATFGVASHLLYLPTPLTDALQQHCVRLRVTPNAFFQTLWGVLLGKYNYQNDVVFGTTVSGRPAQIEGIERMTGLFINTNPVRIAFSADTLLEVLIKNTHRDCLDNEPFQYCKLSDIQAVSPLKRQLFYSLFVYENYPLATTIEGLNGKEEDAAEKQAWQIEQLETFKRLSDPLILVVTPGPSFSLKWEYNASLYEAADIETMATRFQHLLAMAVKDTSTTLGALALSDALPTDAPLPLATLDILTDIKQAAARHPKAKCLEMGPDSWSRGTLQENADRIAHYLHTAIPAVRGKVVAVQLVPGPIAVAAMLGCLHAGAVYLEIAPDYPPSRLQTLLDSGKAALLLSGKETTGQSILGAHCVDNLENFPLGTSPAVTALLPNEPACAMLYLSDLQEQAVVPLSYDQLCAQVDWLQQQCGMDESDRWWISPASACAVPLLAALRGGAPVCWSGVAASIPPSDTTIAVLDLQEYTTIARQTHPTRFLPPWKLAVLLENQPESASNPVVNLPVKSLFIWTAPYQSAYLAYRHQSSTYQTIPGQTIQVLEAMGHPAGTGMTGMMCVLGENAHAYQPTGILGRRLIDGSYLIVSGASRTASGKNCVIALAAIEQLLRRQEGVLDAAIKWETTQSGIELTAWVVCAQEAAAVSGLSKYVQPHLPTALWPSRYIKIDELPLRPDGDIDYGALNTREGWDTPTAAKPIAETAQGDLTEGQRLLLDAAEKILDRPAIGLHDHFFDLGGDSIRAIQIISRLYRAGYRLEAADIFEHPVFADMASCLKPLLRQADQGTVTGSTPLSAIQRDFFERSKRHPEHYNQAILLYAPQACDPDLLRKIFEHIQVHHDALRARFKLQDEGILQEIADLALKPHYQFTDLSTSPDATTILEKMAAGLQSSCTLATGPLLRVAHFRLADGDRLLIIAHHLVVDGLSWRILLEDLELLYQQAESGHPLQLPIKTDSFKKWVETLDHYAQSASFQKNTTYWRTQLARNIAPLPFDAEPMAEQTASSAVYSLDLDADLSASLLQAAHRAYGTHINDLLLSGLTIALNRVLHLKEAWVMLEGHGRNDFSGQLNISRTVGWFTCVYPVYLVASDPDALGEQIKMVKETLHNVPEQGIGYGLLKYSAPASARQDLDFVKPQILFNYPGQFNQSVAEGRFVPASEASGPTQSPEETPDYPLSIWGLAINGRLQFQLGYDTGKFSPPTVARLGEAFKTALQAIVNHCDNQQERTFTPSDFGYDELSLQDLDDINTMFNSSITAP